MLQFNEINRELLHDFEARSGFPPNWTTMAELERSANEWIARLRHEREERAKSRDRLQAWAHGIDRALRTERPEYLDRDDVSPKDKHRIVRALHRLNQSIFSYHRFLGVLEPHIARIERAEGRRVRLLELASGSGEFTLAVAALAKSRSLPVDVTGSDVVPEYIDQANAQARKRSLDVRFIELNAFDMGSLAPSAHDLVFIAQSIHHFTPGQIAMMIAQSTKISKYGLVAIDGQRSLRTFGLLGVSGLSASIVTLRPYFVHDAVTSARKLYSEAELELIARIAAPDFKTHVRSIMPGQTVLEVLPQAPT